MKEEKKEQGVTINLREQIEEALKSLSEKERTVLKMRYGLSDGEEHTLKKIGKELDLSAERIQQIESVALRKLIHVSRSRNLKEFETQEKEEQEKIAEFQVDTSILLISEDIYKSLIKYYSDHPEELRKIDHRKLEEMIAELFSGFGYDVELTAQTRDGGKDIIAIKDSEVKVKYLIEAKRPEPGTPIGVGPVRELYGVKTDEKATKAILATTTYFTAPAKALQEDHIWELELRDYEGIMAWIHAYKKGRKII